MANIGFFSLKSSFANADIALTNTPIAVDGIYIHIVLKNDRNSEFPATFFVNAFVYPSKVSPIFGHHENAALFASISDVSEVMITMYIGTITNATPSIIAMNEPTRKCFFFRRSGFATGNETIDANLSVIAHPPFAQSEIDTRYEQDEERDYPAERARHAHTHCSRIVERHSVNVIHERNRAIPGTHSVCRDYLHYRHFLKRGNKVHRQNIKYSGRKRGNRYAPEHAKFRRSVYSRGFLQRSVHVHEARFEQHDVSALLPKTDKQHRGHKPVLVCHKMNFRKVHNRQNGVDHSVVFLVNLLPHQRYGNRRTHLGEKEHHADDFIPRKLFVENIRKEQRQAEIQRNGQTIIHRVSEASPKHFGPEDFDVVAEPYEFREREIIRMKFGKRYTERQQHRRKRKREKTYKRRACHQRRYDLAAKRMFFAGSIRIERKPSASCFFHFQPREI